MSNDPNPAPAGSPTPSNSPGAPAAGVTAEQVKEIVQGLVNPLFAEVRRLKATPEGAPPAPKGGDNPEGERSLKDRLAVVEAKDAKADRRLRDSAIRDTAAELGVPAARLKVLKAVIESEYGERIKLDDKDETVYDDGLEPMPLKTFLEQYLKSADGEMFRPPVKTPTQIPAGGRHNQPSPDGRSYSELSDEERLKLTPAQREAYLRPAFGV